MGCSLARPPSNWGVKTQNGVTSRWAHVLVGVALSSPLWSLLWRVFLPWNGNVKGWAVDDPGREDNGEGEGPGVRVIRIETNGREMLGRD